MNPKQIQAEVSRLNGGLLAQIRAEFEDSRAAEREELRQKALLWCRATLAKVENARLKHGLSREDIGIE